MDFLENLLSIITFKRLNNDFSFLFFLFPWNSRAINKEYGDLLPEQKALLNRFITSFNENEVDFRLYVGTELKRIKESVEESLKLPEVQDDQEMIENTHRVIEQVSSFNVSNLSEQQILKILKLQKLVREYEKDANKD